MATDPKKLQKVIELIENGASEQAACKKIGVPRSTFRQAAVRIANGVTYARACEALAHDQVEKLESVLQEVRDGAISTDIAKLELDARKWLASRLFRPTWGDKMAVIGGTPGQDEPLTVTTDLDRAKAVAALVAKAKQST